MATAVLSVAFLPIVASVHSLFRLAHRSQEATHGTFLVRAVIENLHHLLHDGDDRESRRFFLALDEAPRPVVDVSGQTVSVYFRNFSNLESKIAAGLSEESNPTLFRQLRAARVRVEVHVDDGSSRTPLDADGDMRAERDMCEVRVEVVWPDESGNERRKEAWTALTRRELLEPPAER